MQPTTAAAAQPAFKVTDGKLSSLVWSEHYTVHGPNPDRQEAAHAHFASFSPDNRFAYINDLGGDMIHIYTFDTETAVLKNAGAYHAAAGSRSTHASLPSQRPHRLLR